MEINSNIKLYLLLIGIMVIGLFVWRFSTTLFSRFNKSSDSIFDQSAYRKRWKRK
tara:strand:+ start:291 stop:455 length:165 start_codon:yes stop_codon:yes gene_type:complete